MKQYFKIYKALIKINFSILLIYRVNFINSIISTIGWGIFQIIFMSLLTSKTKSAFGWSSQEMMILVISYVIIIALFHFIFSQNFDYLSRVINRGELDYFLLKPVDSQFLISTSHIAWANLFRFFLGVGFMIYYINRFNFHLSIVNIIGFFTLMIFGLTLLYSIWFIITTVLIWYPNLDNLVDVLYTLNGFARYPSEMFKQINSFVIFFIIPYTLIIATPTKALFDKVLSGDIFILLLVSIGLFFASRKFWKFALRFYTSASN